MPNYNEFVFWLIPHEAVDLCLDAMFTIEITQKFIPRLQAVAYFSAKPQTASVPNVNDVTQDYLVDTRSIEASVNETQIHEQ